MSGRTALVLDFDGVICDSIDECFASSWFAYYALHKRSSPTHVSLELRRDFARLRPFVRTGEDFLLIQEIIDTGRHVEDQAGFDALAREAGWQKMTTFKDLFHSARSTLIEQERESWLKMNRVYTHVLAGFSLLPRSAPLFVLSTKRPEFIAEVLAAAMVEIPRQRIRFSGPEQKVPLVESMRSEVGAAKAIFVDDQIDHLLGDRPPAIELYLASWGYVKQEWLREPTAVPVLSPSGFLSLIEREFPRG